MLNASAAAMRTHLQEKLEALRAAVINTALGMSPDKHEQLMSIGFVEDLTALPLRLLCNEQWDYDDPTSIRTLTGI